MASDDTLRRAQTRISELEAELQQIQQERQVCDTGTVEALRASEARYRQLIETTLEGVWMLNPAGVTTYVNPQMASMLGYTVEEMQGRALFEFMDDASRALAQHLLERRRQGIAEIHDFRFRRKDGTDLWTMVVTNPIVDQHGEITAYLGMVTDITARKQAEDTLAQRERELSTLTQHVPDTVDDSSSQDNATAAPRKICRPTRIPDVSKWLQSRPSGHS